MMNTQSEVIKKALARAIQNAADPSLQATAQRLAASDSSDIAESQFPPADPPGPFVRSTF